MTTHEIARIRLRNQILDGSVLDGPEEVIEWLGAVQAQDYPAAKWGVAQRASAITSSGFDRLFNEGRILRTHVMRPTWHFVLPADIRWMLKLTAPRVKAATTSYDRRLELNDALYGRCNERIASALQGGQQLTRKELAAMLRAAGIQASGSRLGHIMMRAELDAIICSGPLRGKQFTYALLDDRVPESRSMEREEALSVMAGRYFRSHGPATLQDFAWWSGLPAADARSALDLVKPEFSSETMDGKTFWFSEQPRPRAPRKPIIHLLPNYDEHVVAYRDHGPTLDQAALNQDRSDDTLSAHLIARNGLVIGGWRQRTEKNSVLIRTKLHISLSKTEKAELHAAAEKYSRFIELPAMVSN